MAESKSNYNEFPWSVVDRDRDRDRAREFFPAPAIPDEVLHQLAAMETQRRIAEAEMRPDVAALYRQRSEEMYRMTERNVRQRLERRFLQPSPISERGLANYSGGDGMSSPFQMSSSLQWSQPPGDPLEFPTAADMSTLFWNNPTVPRAVFPNAPWEPIPVSTRESDLRRRLDEVRDILGMSSRTRRIREVGVWDTGPNPHGTSFSNVRVFIGVDEVERLNQLLSHDEVPPLIWEPDDDANTWGEVTNRRGERGRIQLTGRDGREHGTILDAAARSVRRFRLVEE